MRRSIVSLVLGHSPLRAAAPGFARIYTLEALQGIGPNGETIDNIFNAQVGYFEQNATWTADVSAPVPEPASILLMGSGLAGLAVWRRRFAR